LFLPDDSSGAHNKARTFSNDVTRLDTGVPGVDFVRLHDGRRTDGVHGCLCPSGQFGEQRRGELLSATPRRATCSYIRSERHHPDGEIGDARVAVAAQPRENRRFVAHRHGVADVLGVAVLEQPNIVGRRPPSGPGRRLTSRSGRAAGSNCSSTTVGCCRGTRRSSVAVTPASSSSSSIVRSRPGGASITASTRRVSESSRHRCCHSAPRSRSVTGRSRSCAIAGGLPPQRARIARVDALRYLARATRRVASQSCC